MKEDSTVTAPQYGVSVKDHLSQARKRRDEAQRALSARVSATRTAAEKLQEERDARMERVKQTEEAVNTLLMARRGHEATELVELEIKKLINELDCARTERDKSWVAWRMLCFTAWRGLNLLNEVEAVLERVYRDTLSEKMTEKLARLLERQTEYLREQAKRKGIIRSGKTERDRRNGVHARHNQNRVMAASERSERAHQHH